MPSARIYSMIITRGKKSSAVGLNPIPDIKITIKTTTKESSIFTKQLVTNEMGRTSLGK
jgi:hypothetical protein